MVLTGIIVAMNVPSQQVELTDWQWTFFMLAFLSSIALTVAGIILGVTAYHQRKQTTASLH